MQRAVFCGREKELKYLQAAWQKVLSEQKPQLVTLVAESGLGKTRLVQEFYEWLVAQSKSDKGESYWPAKLSQDDKTSNLIVNPELDKVNSEMVMPFMWWALRLNNPNDRNQLSSRSVNTHLKDLTPHLQAMYKARRIKKYQMESGKIAASVVASFIPFVSGIVEVGSVAFELFDVAKDIVQDKSLSPQEADKDEIKDQNTRLLHDLAELLQQNKQMSSIPMVWVIDDAQFSNFDPSLVRLFIDMLRRAQQEGWPILILLSYWEKEWHLQYDDHQKPNLAHAIRQHYKMLPANKTWQPYELKNIEEDGLAPVLKVALPGLTDEQSKALLTRADGNPRFLEELIKLCQGRPRYFEERDINKALKPSGFAEVLEISTSLHEVVEKRFIDMPKGVQGLISLSSLQGMSLLHLISQRTVDKLLAKEPKLQDCNEPENFDKAEKPHAFINKLSKNYSEFSQRVFYEVAQAAIENYIDLTDAENALRQALKELLAERAGLSLSDNEEELLLKLATEILEESQDSQEQKLALDVYLSLLKIALAEYDYHAALEIAKVILDGEPEKWQLVQIDFNDLWDIYKAFSKMAKTDEALIIAETMQRTAQEKEQSRNLSIAYDLVANILKTKGEIDQALANYQASNKIFQELAEKYDTPETKRDLSVSYLRLAIIALEKRELVKAKAFLEQGLQASLEYQKMLPYHDAEILVGWFRAQLDDLA